MGHNSTRYFGDFLAFKNVVPNIATFIDTWYRKKTKIKVFQCNLIDKEEIVEMMDWKTTLSIVVT